MMQGYGYHYNMDLLFSNLKSLAVDMDIPILIMSKMKDPVDLEVEEWPGVKDILFCDDVLEYCDVIVLLKRNSSYHYGPDEISMAEFKIVKNNRFYTGIFRLEWDKPGIFKNSTRKASSADSESGTMRNVKIFD